MAEEPDFSSGKIEKVIRNFRLKRVETVNATLEWRTQTPPFVQTFYDYIDENDLLPTQGKFVESYLERNQGAFASFDEPQIEAIKARAARAFPSLVRKMHFRALVEESELFDRVEYDPKSDVKSGADATVSYRDHTFAVKCLNPTKRMRRQQINTEPQRDEGSETTQIIFTLDPESAKRVGRFFLYTPKDIDRLRRELDEVLGGPVDGEPEDEPSEPADTRDDAPPPKPKKGKPDPHGEMVDWDEDSPAVDSEDDDTEPGEPGEGSEEGDGSTVLGKIRRILRGKKEDGEDEDEEEES